MAEYIEREAAIEEVCSGCSYEFSDEPCEPCDCEIMARLKAIPAADVVPVRHGRWIWTETGEGDYEQYWVCSACGGKCYWQSKFCSECGARMDGYA